MTKLSTAQARREAEERIAFAVKYLTREFIARPDDLSIRTESTAESFALTVVPHAQDVGKLIGADGVIDKAMRVLVTILARNEGWERVTYVVKDHEGERFAGARTEMKNDPAWDRQRVEDLFSGLCDRLFVKDYEFHWNDREWKSTIMLTIAANEARHVTDVELEQGLSRVFNAIGKCNGRKIFVNMERENGEVKHSAGKTERDQK